MGIKSHLENPPRCSLIMSGCVKFTVEISGRVYPIVSTIGLVSAVPSTRLTYAIGDSMLVTIPHSPAKNLIRSSNSNRSTENHTRVPQRRLDRLIRTSRCPPRALRMTPLIRASPRGMFNPDKSHHRSYQPMHGQPGQMPDSKLTLRINRMSDREISIPSVHWCDRDMIEGDFANEYPAGPWRLHRTKRHRVRAHCSAANVR